MEYTQNFDYRIFDSLIQSNVCFAVYRLAKQKEINLILQTSQDLSRFCSYSELSGQKGFVVAPFHILPDTPLVLIKPDVHFIGERDVFRFLSDYKNDWNHTPALDIKQQSSLNSFDRYSSIFSEFHSELSDKALEKLVLSRTFDVDRDANFSAGISFKKACEKYNANFIFLCHTPETGTWMGVSPELLVAEHENIYKTVALAGTKKLSAGDWDDKNKKEQQIVVDYMQQQLGKVSCNIEQCGPFTVQAGDIEHLKTKLSFALKEDCKIGNLLGLLHPSPAVCGFPKEAAFDFILKKEPYDRRYYSGFVGPLDIDNGSRLYVNLRCMQIGKDILRLYAGGGVLPSSKLKSEWEETENKLQTILSIIN